MSGTNYMDRLDHVAERARDPQEVAHWHERGAEWLERTYMGALTAGAPVGIIVTSILMRLHRASAEEVCAAGVSTLAVDGERLYVNGVCVADPKGLIRGEGSLASAVLLHEAVHIMLMHNIRMTTLFKALKQRGLIEQPGRIGRKSAIGLANLVLDVSVDSLSGEAIREVSVAGHAFLDEHERFVSDKLRGIIATQCDGSLDADDLMHRLSGGSVTFENAFREIVDALMPSALQPRAADAPFGRGETGGEGSGESAGGAARKGGMSGSGEGRENGRGSALQRALEGAQPHVRPLPDTSDEGIEKALREQVAVVAAAGRAAGQGTALGRMCIGALEHLQPAQVSWQDQLSAVLGGLGHELGYRRLDECGLHRGIALPTPEPGVGVLGLAFDTSGSVVCDAQTRRDLLSELSALLASAPFDQVVFMPTDTRVKRHVMLDPGDELPDGDFVGGCGTSFNDPFDYVQREGIEVDAMLYFTDGEGHCTVDEPEYPVIWLYGSRGRTIEPPFGEQIHMQPTQA